jgi:hypothetical protein
MLGVTYKTAWFMAHRIREAMKEDVKSSGPLGGEGKTVEADETYIGKKDDWKPNPKATKRGKGGPAAKRTVVGLVERGGKSRMFHMNNATKDSVREVLVTNVSRDTNLYTDKKLYTVAARIRSPQDDKAFSEGICPPRAMAIHLIRLKALSVFKRGMVGVFCIAAKLPFTVTLPNLTSVIAAAPL